ncbi:SDR family oxidoreductase [soil metagenome]
MKGKTALITGSAAGLGFSIAEELARSGCHVALHGIEPAAQVEPERARLAHAHGVEVSYTVADLSEAAATERLIGQVQTLHGAIDILVNNAVVRHFAGIAEFPPERWDQALAVNLSAAFHAIRLCLPAMRSSGWGRIFNMTSVYGSRGVANRVDYVTTKTALIGLTRSVAVETNDQGITCNALCPGAVLTPTSENRIAALVQETGLSHEQATRKFLQGKNPNQRFVDPAHIGQLVVFLCGEAGRDITGAVLPVEGGWLAG